MKVDSHGMKMNVSINCTYSYTTFYFTQIDLYNFGYYLLFNSWQINESGSLEIYCDPSCACT